MLQAAVLHGYTVAPARLAFITSTDVNHGRRLIGAHSLQLTVVCSRVQPTVMIL